MVSTFIRWTMVGLVSCLLIYGKIKASFILDKYAQTTYTLDTSKRRGMNEKDNIQLQRKYE